MQRWILLAMASVAAAQNCDRYICKPNWMEWPQGTCGVYNAKESTWYIEDTCKSGEVCIQTDSNSHSNYTCSVVNTPPTIIYPGSICGSGYICSNDPSCAPGEECPGQSVGESCSGPNKFCAPWLYCASDDTCQRQKTKGSLCTKDSECQVDLGCWLDPSNENMFGTCTPYFSLGSGNSVNPKNYDKEKFISYFCYHLSAFETSDGKIRCSDPVVLNNTSPHSCSTDNNCRSLPIDGTGMTVSSHCTCGINPYRNKYCSLLMGDSDNSEALSIFRRWIHSYDYLYHCSEPERLVLGTCAMNWWPDRNYTKTTYYRMRGSLYSIIEDSYDCVVKALYPAYYELEQEVNNIIMKQKKFSN